MRRWVEAKREDAMRMSLCGELGISLPSVEYLIVFLNVQVLVFSELKTVAGCSRGSCANIPQNSPQFQASSSSSPRLGVGHFRVAICLG